MTGIHEFAFFKISANGFVAKRVNIRDIHCVSRLGSCSRYRSTDSVHEVIAFDGFDSHGSLAQTFSEVSKVIKNCR